MLLTALQSSLFAAALLGLLFWPLERLWPARRQPLLRPHLGTDFLFMFGQHLGFGVLALAVLSFVDALTRGALPLGLRDAFLALPRPAQLLLVVLLGDAAVYWFHRACHRFEFLWRFHAVHHSSETLDWVAAHREHPVDGLLTQLTLNLPAILLGFPVEGLAALAVFRGLWATFIHSNVKLPLGPLRYLLGAPELHHWHHAKEPGVVANFGNLSPWTDLLFGTFHLPRGEERWELGVPEALPRSWPGLMVAPFTRAWAHTRDLLHPRMLGPAALALLVAITFGGVMAFAQPPDAGTPPVDAGVADAGTPSSIASLFGSGSYLPATKAFGPSPGGTGGFGGLGLRGAGPPANDVPSIGNLRAPAADPSQTTVMGNMSTDVIRRVVQRHRAAVKACLNQELLDGGVVEGKVVVKFVIDPSGSVSQSTLVQTTVHRPALEGCVVAAMRAMKFPEPRGGGVVIVNYPFVFATAK